ncbi:MAG TPA: hypothetical protein VIK31_03235 [Propionibacteriaceae bacterium]
MKLAIADPPYPPAVAERFDVEGGRLTTRSRARRYYGDGTRCSDEKPADFHPAAGEWDAPERHRALMRQLLDEYDGWAIATTPDGLATYGALPVSARLLTWVKPNNPPSGHRIRPTWEAVILYPPQERRGRAAGLVAVSDVLICASPRIGFAGAKPAEWTRWVLEALGYQEGDVVTDLFPGSGSVTTALENYAPPLEVIS